MSHRGFFGLALRSTLAGTLALALGAATAVRAEPSSVLPRLFVSSTVPQNGDLSPRGVAFVPPGFPSGGSLSPGDVLVSNFSNRDGLQGLGTTIIRVTPNGPVAPFVPPGTSGAASVFFESPLSGLTSALGVLQRGFVLVGNVPTTDGTAATLAAGGLHIIDRSGRQVAALSDAKHLDSPWSLAVHDLGSTAQVFVSNAASGTVSRLDLSVGSRVSVLRMAQIATGYGHRTDRDALLLGPTGLAYDAKLDVLYVASAADNAVFAVPHAGRATQPVDRGIRVFADRRLHGPLGLAFAGNGNLIASNGDAVNGDVVHPSEIVEFTRLGGFVRQSNIDASQGAAFGLAARTDLFASAMAATNGNANDVLVFNSSAAPREDVVRCGAPAVGATPPSSAPPSATDAPAASAANRSGTPAKRRLEPVCPAGQIPVLKPFEAPKGNPLLPAQEQLPPDGPLNFSRFEDVYGGDSQGPDNPDGPGNPDNPGIGRRAAALAIATPPCLGTLAGAGCYYYASAGLAQVNAGGASSASVHLPIVVTSGDDAADPNTWDHSLAELAVSDNASHQNIIEVGWRVSPLGYQNGNPHIFVYHWVNGTTSCYDGCGWVQNPKNSWAFPGRDIAVLAGQNVQFGISRLNFACGSSPVGNWWIWFDDGSTRDWMGCFPGTLWNPALQSTLLQWFGEVFTLNGVPQKTEMGSGVLPASSGAARFFRISYIDATNGLRFLPGVAPLPFAPTPLAYGGVVTKASDVVLTYGGKGQ